MPINPAVEQKSGELFRLLQPHRTSDVMQRVNLHVMSRTGKKLPEYIQNGASDDEKIALLDELIAIIRPGEWDKLPAVPKGQAMPASSSSPATPAAKPASVAAAPKPAAPVSPPWALSHTGPSVAASAPVPRPDLLAELGKLLAKIIPPAPPAVPSLTEADTRRIAREELAHVFVTVADVLRKKD